MKFIVLTLCLCITAIASAQSSLLRVYTMDKDVEKAGFYYYKSFGQELEKELLSGVIPVYSDPEGKKQIDVKSFNEENDMHRLIQIINPETPDDPYNLIDTQMHYKHPVSEANYMHWHDKMLEFRSNTLKGLKSYYVRLNDLNDFEYQDGYALLQLFSKQEGQISPSIIQNTSSALLLALNKKMYEPTDIQCFRDDKGENEISKTELYDTLLYYKGSDMAREVYYYPKSEEDLRGIVMSYASERENTEFELEVYSIAPLYELQGLSKAKPWYWAGVDDAEDLFTAMEWNALMSIQSYSLKRKIFSSFEHTSNP